MQIKAATVKELRERTGAGMMDCKKALQETAGDIEAAIAHMRQSGAVKAAKKSARITAEGRIVVEQSIQPGVVVILEVNSETDFVAKDAHFVNFCSTVAGCLLEHQSADIASLMALDAGGQSLEDLRLQLVANVGENINVRRFQIISSDKSIGTYLHGGRIGVVVSLDGVDSAAGAHSQLAHDIAMHIAASQPTWIAEKDIPQTVISEERTHLIARAKDSGKPDKIIDKVVDGQLRKFISEMTLLGQPFVKDPEHTVAELLSAQQATVTEFIRYELGEGLEKRADNFVQEVMAQAADS